MPEASTYPGDLVLRAGKACAVLRPAAGGSGTLDGLFMGRPGVAGDVTLFRCRDRTCAAPAVGAAAVAAAAVIVTKKAACK